MSALPPPDPLAPPAPPLGRSPSVIVAVARRSWPSAPGTSAAARRPPTRRHGRRPRTARRARAARARQGRALRRRSRPRRSPWPRRPRARGDINIVQTALGTVTALRTVTVKPRVDGQLQRVALHRGPDGEGRATSLAQIDPVPLQVALAPGRGHARARRGAAQQRAPRPRALPHAPRAGLDRAAAGRPAGRAGAPARGHGEGRPGAGRQRQAAALVHAHHGAHRRAPGPARRSTPATWCAARTPTGIAVITQVDPITVLFTIPQDTLPRVLARLNAGRQARGRGVGPRAEEPARARARSSPPTTRSTSPPAR